MRKKPNKRKQAQIKRREAERAAAPKKKPTIGVIGHHGKGMGTGLAMALLLASQVNPIDKQ